MKLQAPEHVDSVCIGSKVLPVVDGTVEVSDAEVLILASHGFLPLKVLPKRKQDVSTPGKKRE